MKGYFAEVQPKQNVTFKITTHFVDMLQSRAGIGVGYSKDQLVNFVKGVIEQSYVITDRPNNVRVLLKNGINEAIYLYHPGAALVLVVEKERKSGEFGIIKTAYKAADSGWLQYWLKKTPATQRTMWRDFSGF